MERTTRTLIVAIAQVVLAICSIAGCTHITKTKRNQEIGVIHRVLCEASSLVIDEEGANSVKSFGVKLNVKPVTAVTVQVWRAKGFGVDVKGAYLNSAATDLVFNASNWTTCQDVAIAAVKDLDTENNAAVITCEMLEYGEWQSADVVVTQHDTFPPAGATDRDQDGLPDSWENEEFGNLDQSATGDPDNDDLPNNLEYLAGTNPMNPDTDGDDFEETTAANPVKNHKNSDGGELYFGTNPNDNQSGRFPPEIYGDALKNDRSYYEDIDMDSLNRAPYAPPSRTPAEETAELEFPGKVIEVNAERFVPVVFTCDVLGGLWRSWFRIDYDKTDFKLWTKDRDRPRSDKSILEGGSYVPPGTYPIWKLGIGDSGTGWFYFERVAEDSTDFTVQTEKCLERESSVRSNNQ